MWTGQSIRKKGCHPLFFKKKKEKEERIVPLAVAVAKV
jgi:hypothetical protein